MLKLIVIAIIIGVVNLTHTGYYEILGITKQASTQEIRQAYKKLAVKFHPDKNSDTEDQKKFIEITEAYETLKDPEKRKKYDLYGSFPSYTRQYDHRSQAEYNNLFYNGLYHEDPYVKTLSGKSFYTFLGEGFHFINFYSPFCPPCQNLVDHWKKLAEIYKGIVKIGAVNCKYHNSFCYNSMRIGSYPSLLFYPNGKTGNYIYYRGERTFEALNQFLMSYISNRVVVPVVSRLKTDDAPMAYVLGTNRVDQDALARIAYTLKGLVTLVTVEDEDLRSKLTDDEYTTVVYRFKGRKTEIKSTDEKEVLKDIVDALPKTELVGPEKLKEIRNKLRSGYRIPWVLYFSSKDHDRLEYNQMKQAFPDMHFGEVDCSTWRELCASLQAARGAWGVLKAGGAYQRAAAGARAFLSYAPRATRTHSLSASEFTRILNAQDVGTWVLVVVPQQLSWEHISDIFTRVSLEFLSMDNINFGIMACTPAAETYCRQVTNHEPAVLIQQGGRRHYYDGSMDFQELVDFIQLVLDSEDIDLDEKRVLEILDASSRQHSWVVAFLPPRCGRPCRALAHQWRLVQDKLRPLEFVRVGMLQCEELTTGFCANIRSPTARLYPIASGQHYSVSLQHLSQAPYIWEWALGLIDDSVQKLNWQTFNKLVISEDLHLNSNKKPWLVYFHSPRCYRCYEMYADFAMAGIFLNNAVELGKVNCISERPLCQHENIRAYPALRLYRPRGRRALSAVLALPPQHYSALLDAIRTHLDDDIGLDVGVRNRGFSVKHDEF